MDIRALKTAFILNIVLGACVTFAVVWMMSGLNLGVFSASRLAMLKFFTVDSNILMGVAAIVCAVYQHKILKGELFELPVGAYVLKLAATVSVTLTMLITAFFLAPAAIPTTGYFSLFYYSNFFLHLLNPVLAIVVFVLFEKTGRIAFKHTFTGVIPLVLYAIYYVATTVIHSENGVIAQGYDWYGFFFGGLGSVFVVLPIILLLTYLISFVLWKLNRRNAPLENLA